MTFLEFTACIQLGESFPGQVDCTCRFRWLHVHSAADSNVAQHDFKANLIVESALRWCLILVVQMGEHFPFVCRQFVRNDSEFVQKIANFRMFDKVHGVCVPALVSLAMSVSVCSTVEGLWMEVIMATKTRRKPTPCGQLTTRTLTMPADTNPAGDIFGGWVLAEMDKAGAVCAAKCAGGRVVTVAIDAMTFIEPVFVGDVLSVYCDIARIGRTSITVQMEAWALRNRVGEEVKVTEGTFVFVSVDSKRKPKPVKSRT